MTDEGLREIQLDGKQLVFLFMAATVVAVVIFLCGVMVGRGVSVAGRATAVRQEIDLDPTAASQNPLTQASITDARGPSAPGEDLSYPGQLLNDDATLAPVSEAADALPEPIARQPPAAPRRAAVAPKPVSQPKPAATVARRPATPTTSAAPAPRAALAPRPAAPSPAASAQNLTEPTGEGFVVQVAAVRQRIEANNIARRLSGKGYPAFVTTSGSNFRVRIGKYPNRREAEAVANRLEREERFEPWVTR